MGLGRSLSLRSRQQKKPSSHVEDQLPPLPPKPCSPPSLPLTQPRPTFGTRHRAQTMKLPESIHQPLFSPNTGKRRQASVDNRDISTVNPLRSQPSEHFTLGPRDEKIKPVPKSAIGVALGSPARPRKAATRVGEAKNGEIPHFSTPCYAGVKPEDGATANLSGFPQRRPSKWKRLGTMLRKKESRPPSPPMPLTSHPVAAEAVRDSDEALRPAPLRIRSPNARHQPKMGSISERADSTSSTSSGAKLRKRNPELATLGTKTEDMHVPLQAEIVEEVPQSLPPKSSKPAPTLMNIEIPSVKMERYSVMFADVLKTDKRASLLTRRQATLEQRRSKRASNLRLPPMTQPKEGPLPPTPEETLAEAEPKIVVKPRAKSKERKLSNTSGSSSRSSSADRRQAVKAASKRSSVKDLPPPPKSPLPAIPSFSRPLSPTPVELPPLTVLSSPSSTEPEVKGPETPGKPRPGHERSASLPSISPVLASNGFDDSDIQPFQSMSSSLKNNQIVVLIHSPTKDLPQLPTLYENETVKNARMSLTPNRLNFVGKDLLRDKQSVQLSASVTITGGLAPTSTSAAGSLDDMSLARQVSMRRRQLLLPILNRTQQHREQLAAEAEKAGQAQAKDMKPRLVDLRHTEGRRSQQVELDHV